jgi:membrane protein DedA with SNARE-associated domain
MKSPNTDNELENPCIFWASIGVAISASMATIMKFSIFPLILTIIAGLLIGMGIGYFNMTGSDKNIVKKELKREQKLKLCWQRLTKAEKSALAMLSFIFMLIMLFVSGSIIGQAIFS